MKFRLAAIMAMLLAVTAGCAYSAVKPEFRGVQVHTWIPGMLSAQEIDDTIKWTKSCNMNVIMFQARKVGDAYYNSAYEPRAANIKGDKDFDPIGYAVKKSHENGIQVWAWVNVYRVWGGGKAPYPNHITNTHPEWLNKTIDGKSNSSGDGQFLDPGIPEVRDYTVKIIGDILSKYDVDGIMLDFVRYPGRDWGYSDIAVSRFNKAYNRTGKPDPKDLTWARWRREQVTQMVRDIKKEIDRQKPYVTFSAATIPWGPCPTSWNKTDAYTATFQDWRLWMEQGLLDVNMPMNYKNPTRERDQAWYIDWLEGMKKWAYGRVALSTVMVMSDSALDGAVDQMKQSLDHGLPGAVAFAFSQRADADKLAAGLKAKVFPEPAPVPLLPWKAKRPAK